MLIESRVIARLAGQMPGVLVCAEVPEDFPADAALVVVERLGVSETDRLRRARLAVQSYGLTLLDAAERNEAALLALKTLTDDPAVSACRVESSYNFTDEARKRYRYQAVVHVTYYNDEEE